MASRVTVMFRTNHGVWRRDVMQPFLLLELYFVFMKQTRVYRMPVVRVFIKGRSKKVTYEVYYTSLLSALGDIGVMLLPYCVLEIVRGVLLARREIFTEEGYKSGSFVIYGLIDVHFAYQLLITFMQQVIKARVVIMVTLKCGRVYKQG